MEEPREFVHYPLGTYQIQPTSEVKGFHTSTSSTSSQQHGGILQRSPSQLGLRGQLLQVSCIAIQYWPFIQLIYRFRPA